MPITLNCTCGRKSRVKDELTVKRIRCRDCSGVIDVPAGDDDVVTDCVVDEPPAAAAVQAERPQLKPPGASVPVVSPVQDRADDGADDGEAPRPRRKKRLKR